MPISVLVYACFPKCKLIAPQIVHKMADGGQSILPICEAIKLATVVSNNSKWTLNFQIAL